MKKELLFLLSIFICININAQDSVLTVYGKLPIYKIIAGGYVSITDTSNKTNYSINNKKVNETEYNQGIANINLCSPCIAVDFNQNNIKISETIQYSDCGVGWFKEFYPNGKIKRTGHYKENPTGNWKNIWDRGYCSIKDNKWTYFKENGDTLYSEFWNNGEFIKQLPEQNIPELWDIELTLNNLIIDTQTIAINQIGHLKINPKYKNSNTSLKLTLTFEVSADGYIVNEKPFSLSSFKNIDVSSMLLNVGIPKEKKTYFILNVLNNGQVIKVFYLNVEK